MAVHGEIHQPHRTLCTDREPKSRRTHRDQSQIYISINLLSSADDLIQKSPHGVEDSPVLHNAEELVGCGHVMGNGPLGVSEESVWRPDFVHHAVIQPQDFNGAFEFQPLINPHLAEEHVHGVLLRHKHTVV